MLVISEKKLTGIIESIVAAKIDKMERSIVDKLDDVCVKLRESITSEIYASIENMETYVDTSAIADELSEELSGSLKEIVGIYMRLYFPGTYDDLKNAGKLGETK